jgi:GxxExxY protein
MTLDRDPLVARVIGCMIDVHRALGPGLLESAYAECLAFEFVDKAIGMRRQVPLPVSYKNVHIDCGFRLDFLVEGRLVLELKSVERLLPIHQAQVLTYLKLLGCRRGLLVNFNVTLLKDGLKSLVL